MDKAERSTGRPLNPFERFVSGIAQVPKGEVDALEAARKAETAVQRGPKKKPKPPN
jgi:hypothetical protein